VSLHPKPRARLGLAVRLGGESFDFIRVRKAREIVASFVAE